MCGGGGVGDGGVDVWGWVVVWECGVWCGSEGAGGRMVMLLYGDTVTSVRERVRRRREVAPGGIQTRRAVVTCSPGESWASGALEQGVVDLVR